MVMGLFKTKRKKEIRSALRRGDADVFRRGRPAPPESEQEHAATTTTAPVADKVPEEESVMTLAHSYSLIQAAREGDLQGVTEAIRDGADVHTSRYVSQELRPRPKDCVIRVQMTPLEGAEEGGNQEIIELLKRHGAKR